MQRQQCPNCQGTRLKDEALSVHIDGKILQKSPSSRCNSATLGRKNSGMTPFCQRRKTHRRINSQGNHFPVRIFKCRWFELLKSQPRGGNPGWRRSSAHPLGFTDWHRLDRGFIHTDEPTIGLHQRDNHRLIETLKNLQHKGNTVVVVEHDRDLMLASDHIIDFGPLAGKQGGEVVAAGTPDEVMANPQSLTGKYLARKKDVAIKKNNERRVVSDDEEYHRERSGSAIRISGARHNNLKNVDVEFPLNKLVCITGISGSGKSTLLHDTLYAHLAMHLDRSIDMVPGPVDSITVPDVVRRVSLIDQSPIGRTPRSNPATYTKIFDYIRKAFANTQDAQIRGYGPGRFSFNVKGGRCEACQGDGQIKIEMQFLPDVYVTCDVCEGKRYNAETLEVQYRGKNIFEVLKMPVDEALEFFKHNSTIKAKLQTLQEVGLGYIELGQPAPTLSGGEAQRVKLARELSTRTYDHVVYLLDEPTTGLHFEDIQKLLRVLHQLVEQGNTVITIEHNLDVIKNSDWVIDLGPEEAMAVGRSLPQAPSRPGEK